MATRMRDRFWQRARGVTRVAALLTALAGVCAWLGIDALRARAHDLAASAGATLLAHGELAASDDAQTVVVNGLQLRLLAGSSRDQPQTVLARLAGECRARAGGLPVQLEERARARLPPRIAARAFDPVLQLADDSGGFVACLDLGGARMQPAELLARMRRFVREADVAEIGALRFAWARRGARGTRYVTLSSDGPLPLARAFPARGDAPGADVPGLPRPERCRRVLSAFSTGAAPILVAYESDAPAGRALASYAAALRAAGHAVQLQPRAADGALGLATEHAGVTRVVFVAPRGRGSLLTITRL